MPRVKKFRLTRNNFIISVLIVFVLFIILGVVVLARDRSIKDNSRAREIAASSNIAYLAGDYQGAIGKLQEGLIIDGNNPILLSSMITVIALEGNRTGRETDAYTKAQPYVKRALAIGAKNRDVLIAVGYITETSGRWQEALDYYDKALKIDPNFAPSWFHRGHSLEFLGRTDEARVAYEEAYRIDSTLPSVLIAKARIELESGNLDKAYDFYMQVAESSGVTSVIRSEALTGASIVARSQLVKMKEALELSHKAFEADPNFAPALVAHGMNLSLNGDLKQGTGYIFRAIQANPRSSGNYWQMGLALRSGKYYSEAIEFQKKGIEQIDQDNTLLGPDAHRRAKALMTYDLAKTYWLAKQSDLVLSTLEEAYKIDSVISLELKKDFEKNGFFKDLGRDSSFLKLLQ